VHKLRDTLCTGAIICLHACPLQSSSTTHQPRRKMLLTIVTIVTGSVLRRDYGSCNIRIRTINRRVWSTFGTANVRMACSVPKSFYSYCMVRFSGDRPIINIRSFVIFLFVRELYGSSVHSAAILLRASPRAVHAMGECSDAQTSDYQHYHYQQYCSMHV